MCEEYYEVFTTKDGTVRRWVYEPSKGTRRLQMWDNEQWRSYGKPMKIGVGQRVLGDGKRKENPT